MLEWCDGNAPGRGVNYYEWGCGSFVVCGGKEGSNEEGMESTWGTLT